ncbi:MAG: hypothetical protein K0S47_3462 [Herbinix sp.]|jgi:hypothetical protein|nr:hypothetical protein [Herbinix sp.]
MMKNIGKVKVKLIAILMISIFMVNLVSIGHAEAASKYITIESFAKALASELNLSPNNGSEENGYVNALLSNGIIKEGDVSSYTKYLTRTDALVFINRADEFLNGNKLENGLVQTAIEKRISDIAQIKESKREDVAKAYLKGFMKGYSNGKYAPNRQIKGASKITKDGALNCIKMLKDKSLRAKISPDGQLIRTTNLPKNAKMYPYILESFPNEYYEYPFYYDNAIIYDENNNIREKIRYEEYTTPKDVDKSISYIEDFPKIKKENIGRWVDKVEKHLHLIFNVNYKTINNQWVEDVLTTDSYYNVEMLEDGTRAQLKKYAKGMKQNKTIIESKVIAIDNSSLYFFKGIYYLRAYVQYRVVSSSVPSTVSVDTIIDSHPYNNIIFSRKTVDLRGYNVGEWVGGIFDIALCEPIDTNGVDMGINYTTIRREVNK